MPPEREVALAIVRRLQAAGHEAYFVGGCVRDTLLGRAPGDYDIATSALPAAVEALFPHTKPVGRKFGVMLVIEGPLQVQVATFRAESDYQDGRRPEQVSFGDPRADAERRDFTINGLFFDPVAGTVRDWVGGEADLQARLIRTIGSADERFAEDHLRLLRAVRFAARLGFALEPETFASIRRNAPKIQGISAERIRDELLKIFRPPHAARGLDLLHETGLLAEVLPEIAAMVTCEQSPEHHPEGTVFNHVRLMLAHLPADASDLLPWAALMHDVAKPVTATRDPETGRIHFYEHDRIGAEMTERIFQRLRFSTAQTEPVVAAVRNHMRFCAAPEMRKATLRRLLLSDIFPLELALHRLDCLGSHHPLDVYDFLVRSAEELANQPQIRPPLLTGHDLLALGLKSGPKLGSLLAELREKQLADELTTRDDALAWVQRKLVEQQTPAQTS